MLAGLFVLGISIGMIAAGVGYVRTAKRMRTFGTTQGTVVDRSLGRMNSLDGPSTDPAFGKGGHTTVQSPGSWPAAHSAR